MAANPERLGAEIGLDRHSAHWDHNLLLHLHIQCAVPAGGFLPEHQRWV
jgi:hypothetical protein